MLLRSDPLGGYVVGPSGDVGRNDDVRRATGRPAASSLLAFQIIRRFDFSRYVVFTMHIDIHYVYIHAKNNVSEKN